jgi:hypothetical protein
MNRDRAARHTPTLFWSTTPDYLQYRFRGIGLEKTIEKLLVSEGVSIDSGKLRFDQRVSALAVPIYQRLCLSLLRQAFQHSVNSSHRVGIPIPIEPSFCKEAFHVPRGQSIWSVHSKQSSTVIGQAKGSGCIAAFPALLGT